MTERKPIGRARSRRHRKGVVTEATQDRMIKALEYRKLCYTYEQIAKEMQISTSYAHELVTKARQGRIKELAEDVVDLETQRLDGYRAALADAATQGDVAAINACVRVSESTRKLLGLDAPQKQEITGRDGNPIQLAPVSLDVVCEEVMERLKALKEAAAMGVPELPKLVVD